MNAFLKCDPPLSASRALGRTFFVLLLVLIGVAASAAQNSKTSGTLEGTISDTSGGLVPGVKVVLRQIETNQTRTVDTDDQGFFRAADLLVGTYEVRIEDSRFAPYLHTGVDLGVGIAVRLDIVLPAASLTTKVTVSAQPPPIDPGQTSVTSTIDPSHPCPAYFKMRGRLTSSGASTAWSLRFMPSTTA